MFKSYLLVTIRNLLRQRAYTLLNVAGLGLGLACAILILIYVRFEFSFDKFQKNPEEIQRITMTMNQGDREAHFAMSMPPLPPKLVDEIPGVKAATRTNSSDSGVLTFNEVNYPVELPLMADDGFFEVFSFPLLAGNPETALKEPNSIVLSKTYADKLFGEGDPLGATVEFDGKSYTVTGVSSDPPKNSSIRYDLLRSFSTLPAFMQDQWGMIMFISYIRTAPSADMAQVEEQAQSILYENFGQHLAGQELGVHFQPFLDIHLRSAGIDDGQSRGSIENVIGFATIAGFILLLACINFINLSTARAAKRAREVGVRKVLGARKGNLVAQFIGESMFITLVALVFAVALAQILLPWFAQLANREIVVHWFSDPWIPLMLTGVLLVVGFVSGSFPAFFLSAFQPTEVLKGSMKKATRGAILRQGLVVGQFVVSIGLIIASVTVYSQIRYLQTVRLGFDKEQVVAFQLPPDAGPTSPQAAKTDLLALGGIESASLSSTFPFGGERQKVLSMVSDSLEPMRFESWTMQVDPDFLKTYGIALASGRDFNIERTTDLTSAIIVNEAAAKSLGWDNGEALDKEIPLGRRSMAFESEEEMERAMHGDNATIQCPIIGVMKDFHFSPLQEKIEPLTVYIDEGEYRVLSLRLVPGTIDQTLGEVKKNWANLYPDAPFNPHFLDQEVNAAYQDEVSFGKLVGAFTVLAIVIALLGLFGLASFTAEARTKEIGVRKVLGASVPDVILLLSRQFTQPVIIGALIASPIAWYFISKWLNNFAYRIEMGWQIYLLSALGGLLLAWIAVGGQALRAARTDPARALRYE
ncbi:ABC transporter permease [bacterium]|nr:ABC transporter permease [bacterium]